MWEIVYIINKVFAYINADIYGGMESFMEIIQQKFPIDGLSIKISYSCAMELVCSLHVISDPSHHGNCMNWYEQTINVVSKPLIERIVTFGQKYNQWNFVMDLFIRHTESITSRSPHNDDFLDSLSKVENYSETEFIYMFLGGYFFDSQDSIPDIVNDHSKLWQHCNSDLTEYITIDNIEYFLNNINIVKVEMLDIIKEYYFCFFQDFWTNTSSFYKNALLLTEKNVNEHFSITYILSLHSMLSYKDGKLLMCKETDFEVKVETIKNLWILLSVFTFPHLMINIFEDTLSLVENLLISNLSNSFDRISNSIKLLSDPTRISMIKMLQKYTMTNKSLSRLLNITPATVSQHLKILKNSNLLISNREKNTIYYQLDNERFTASFKEIQDYFDIE